MKKEQTIKDNWTFSTFRMEKNLLRKLANHNVRKYLQHIYMQRSYSQYIYRILTVQYEKISQFLETEAKHLYSHFTKEGFPGGSAGKESACNVGDLGLIPGLGRSPGEGNGYPLQYSGWRIPWTVLYSPWGLQRVGHN